MAGETLFFVETFVAIFQLYSLVKIRTFEKFLYTSFPTHHTFTKQYL